MCGHSAASDRQSPIDDRPTPIVNKIVPVAKATGYTIYPLRGLKMAEVMNSPFSFDVGGTMFTFGNASQSRLQTSPLMVVILHGIPTYPESFESKCPRR